VIYARDLLDFAIETVHPGSMELWWSPFWIQMPFATEGEGFFADGAVLMPNFVFFILVGMVCFNLIVIWIVEQKYLRQKVS
jgi:hypothetical protein